MTETSSVGELAIKNIEAPIILSPDTNVIVLIAEQVPKAVLPIDVNVEGIIIDFKRVGSADMRNICCPITVRPFVKTIRVRAEHVAKAYDPKSPVVVPRYNYN